MQKSYNGLRKRVPLDDFLRCVSGLRLYSAFSCGVYTLKNPLELNIYALQYIQNLFV